MSKKIHARLSVEIEVSEEEFEKIVKEAKSWDDGMPIPYWMVPRAKPCDWDDGGYIPTEWLESDIKYPEEE